MSKLEKLLYHEKLGGVVAAFARFLFGGFLGLVLGGLMVLVLNTPAWLLGYHPLDPWETVLTLRIAGVLGALALMLTPGPTV